MPEITAAELLELQELRRFKAAVEPVLHHIYDVLYFDSDKNSFDPQKEIDSACDFLDMVHVELLRLYPSPKLGDTEYPALKEQT